MHSETVLRRFCDVHRDTGSGPLLNPFPLGLARRSGRAHAHRKPMDGWKPERLGRYRPSLPRRIPRSIPEAWFNKLFAALPSNRDRAPVAFWISTGVRAPELIGMRPSNVDPGRQLSAWCARARGRSSRCQQLRTLSYGCAYQHEVQDRVVRGRTQPAWWTRREPIHP